MANDSGQQSSVALGAASSSNKPGAQLEGKQADGVLLTASGDDTAGGKPPLDVNLTAGFKTIQPKDFLEFHKYPCVREALLTSIGTGFGTGGLMAVWGKPIAKSCNWAAGVFVFTSMASYEFCKQKRRLERDGMNRAIEIVNRKREEKRLQRQAGTAAEGRRPKADVDRQEAQGVQKPWWKVW